MSVYASVQYARLLVWVKQVEQKDRTNEKKNRKYSIENISYQNILFGYNVFVGCCYAKGIRKYSPFERGKEDPFNCMYSPLTLLSLSPTSSYSSSSEMVAAIVVVTGVDDNIKTERFSSLSLSHLTVIFCFWFNVNERFRLLKFIFFSMPVHQTNVDWKIFFFFSPMSNIKLNIIYDVESE